MRDSIVLIRAGARSSVWGKAALGKADGLHRLFSMQSASFALSKCRLNRGLSLAAGGSLACEWAFPSRAPFVFRTVAPESCLSVANKETAMRSHGRFLIRDRKARLRRNRPEYKRRPRRERPFARKRTPCCQRKPAIQAAFAQSERCGLHRKQSMQPIGFP